MPLAGRREQRLTGGTAANLAYVFSDAMRSLRHNLSSTVFTSVTLGFALAIFSLFFLVFTNLNGMIYRWGEKTHVIAYVKDSHASGPGTFKKTLGAIPGVKAWKFISSNAAFEELRAGLAGHEAILEGVDPGALPASVEITLDEGYLSGEGLKAVVASVSGLDWVEEVTYSREWVERFASFVGFMELAALIVGTFLAAATLFIISNTIRLTVYARREEIEIMRLVGASDAFIKVPFFIEGVVQGVIGGVLALGLLAAGRALVSAKIPPYLDFALDLPLSVPLFLAVLVAAGITLGVAGSFISMARFLKV